MKQGEFSKKTSSKKCDDSKKKGKRRRRKNGVRQEEVYCDKDRAAAVNLGSKDIKQSLKLKQKQDRRSVLQIPEEAEPGTFLALGNYEMCRGDLNIAVNFMGKVVFIFQNILSFYISRMGFNKSEELNILVHTKIVNTIFNLLLYINLKKQI